MSTQRELAPAAYLVGALLVFIPLFDVAMSLYPFNVSSSQWRFGAFGLFSNALMLPATGVLVAAATAAAFGHYRIQQVLRVTCWAVMALLIVCIVLFGLDAVQARQLIRPDMKLSYMVASVTALVKLGLGTIGFALLARGSKPDKSMVVEPRTDSFHAFDKRNSGAIRSR